MATHNSIPVTRGGQPPVIHFSKTHATSRFGKVHLDVLSNQALTNADKIVYGAYIAHRNNKSGKAWPSRSTIASIVGMHPNAVSRCTRRLLDAGLIERDRDGRAIFYTFPLTSNPRGSSLVCNPTVTEPASTLLEGTDNNHATPESTPEELPAQEPAPMSSEASCGEDIQEPQEPKLIPPPGLTSENSKALLALLVFVPVNAAQTLLDELAGRMQMRTINNPIGYLRVLTRLWRAGEFIPELADRIASDRKRREIARINFERATAMRPPTPHKPSPPMTPERLEDHMRGLRAALRGKLH